jgi:TB2/DP1, HVA22 family
MLLPGLAYICRLLSLLGLFWGAYQSYKVLKPKFQVEPAGDEKEAKTTGSTRSRSKSGAGSSSSAMVSSKAKSSRRKTLLRFADGYDSSSGSRMLYYWACLSALFVYESSFLESLVQFFMPLYFEAKLVLLIALLLPNSSAPQWLFEKALHPLMQTAGHTAETKLFPWLAGLVVEGVFNRFLPKVFAWIAPFLHPSDLQAWERLLDRLRRRLENYSGRAPANTTLAGKKASSKAVVTKQQAAQDQPQQQQPPQQQQLGMLSWGWNMLSQGASSAAASAAGVSTSLFGAGKEALAAEEGSDDENAEGRRRISKRRGDGGVASPSASSRSPSASNTGGRSASDGNAVSLRRRKIIATAASASPSLAAAAGASERRPYEDSDDDDGQEERLGYGCARQPSKSAAAAAQSLPPLPQSAAPDTRTKARAGASGSNRRSSSGGGGGGAYVQQPAFPEDVDQEGARAATQEEEVDRPAI